MAVDAVLKDLIREEIVQRAEEGCDVSGLEEARAAISDKADLMDLYDTIQKLRVVNDCPYVEPSHLAGIRACRTGESRRWSVSIDDAFTDRVRGAWLGRIAGCMLGKPVEGWSANLIRKYLESVGEYPLADYIPPPGDKLPDGVEHAPYCTRGSWDHAVADDDTNYTALGLRIMEGNGPGFTTADVGNSWIFNLPYGSVWTAERRAYANLINGLPTDQVATYLNPYREWIGAQIRADFWGYCAPGWPEKAAEFAFRDAALSHIKNGIYGEMFCAAAISAALVTDDVYEIIEAGRAQIPAHSRLAETVADCLKWRKECSTWEEAFGKMLETYYGRYSAVHTNNNLAIVLIGLLFGWPDYEKVITISVMQGMDTDCTGATAGSIIGAALGANALPEKWIEPLGGQLETSIAGLNVLSIDEIAKRTVVQVVKVLGL